MKILLLLAIFFLPVSTLAGEIIDAKIIEIRQRPHSAVIRFDKRFNTSCSDGGVWALFSMEDTAQSKQMWSLILSAAAANKTVTITSDLCSYHNRIHEFSVMY